MNGIKVQDHPRLYTEITVRHIVTGRRLPGQAVRHAIELSEEKYCSAYAILRHAANFSTSFEVRSPDATEAAS
ncbi:MAG TPA: hypothetical protein VF898_05055 [Chloroflexota bacterium]